MNQRRIDEARRFVPQREHDVHSDSSDLREEQIEQVIFDKAEQAQAREELAAERDRLVEDVAALKKKRSDAADEEERRLLDRRIASMEKRVQALDEMLEQSSA